MIIFASPDFLIPFTCAVMYPIATLFIKSALQKGADPWAVTILNYWIMALIFIPAIFLDARPVPWHLWYQPALMGLFSFAGQACAFKAISSGDLTISTPALGAKVLLVALLTEILLKQSVPLFWWLAAGCSFAAIFFLQVGVSAARRKAFTTLFYALLTATFFALGDVLIQKWSPGWGVFHFVPAFAIISVVYSFALIPLVKKPKFQFDVGTYKPLLVGAGVLGVQSLLLTTTIGFFGKATQANIIFSSRGLWNFFLIWFVGHWFSNREKELLSKSVMVNRFIGAGLMFAAIVLASLEH